MTELYTHGEFEAYQLLLLSGRYSLNTTSLQNPQGAGNEIIRLAEQIKAERAVAGMQGREP